jgi:hypothetical protein
MPTLHTLKDLKGLAMSTTRMPNSITERERLIDAVHACTSTVNRMLNRFDDLVSEVRALRQELMAKFETGKLKSVAPQPAGVNLRKMASMSGLDGNAEASTFLRLYAKEYCKSHNIEVERSQGKTKSFEYFPMAAAEYAIAKTKKALGYDSPDSR